MYILILMYPHDGCNGGCQIFANYHGLISDGNGALQNMSIDRFATSS